MSFLRWLRKPTLHKHDFIPIYGSRWGVVQRCECNAFQTLMRDLTTGEVVTVDGNLLCAVVAKRIYILCGNPMQFTDAVQQLARTLPGGEKESKTICVNLQSSEQIASAVFPPVIYLWGTWWENDICQDPRIREALNGWL